MKASLEPAHYVSKHNVLHKTRTMFSKKVLTIICCVRSALLVNLKQTVLAPCCTSTNKLLLPGVYEFVCVAHVH